MRIAIRRRGREYAAQAGTISQLPSKHSLSSRSSVSFLHAIRHQALRERCGTDIGDPVTCTHPPQRVSTATAALLTARRPCQVGTVPSQPHPATPTGQPQYLERPARIHALRERRGADIADLVACTRAAHDMR